MKFIFGIGIAFLALGIATLIDWAIYDFSDDIGNGLNGLTRIMIGSGFVALAMRK